METDIEQSPEKEKIAKGELMETDNNWDEQQQSSVEVMQFVLNVTF